MNPENEKGAEFLTPMLHTGKNTIGDLVQSGAYGEFARFIFTYMTPDHWANRLSFYGYEKVGFEQGLRRMRELAESGRTLHFQVYPREERLSSWDKETVWLEYFPSPQPAPHRPFLLILPGGSGGLSKARRSPPGRTPWVIRPSCCTTG